MSIILKGETIMHDQVRDASAGNLYVGWAMASITPKGAVRLRGQFYERISRYVQSDLTVTVLALETRDDAGRSMEQMMIGACDLASVSDDIMQDVRAALGSRLTDFDTEKLFLNATHTHTAPYTTFRPISDKFIRLVPEEMRPETEEPDGIESAAEYRNFLIDRLCEAFTQAWNGRAPGAVSSRLGHAVLGHNRRVVYDDGSALMYGTTDTVNFYEPEGAEDHGVELLYFWDREGSLTGAAVNVACPSQVLEHHYFVSADYWGEARRELAQRGLEKLFILPLCGAAGDQSPRDMVRRGRGEPNMHEIEGAKELGRRLADAIVENIGSADEAMERVAFRHRIIHPALPIRTVGRLETERAKAEFQSILDGIKPGERLQTHDIVRLYNPGYTLMRAELQQKKHFVTPEIHIVRLGETAIATNSFELFILYGLQIKARSRASQTVVVQLACDSLGYLPTQKAVEGGHYSAYVASSIVGPEGGKCLVNQTVQAINELWA